MSDYCKKCGKRLILTNEFKYCLECQQQQIIINGDFSNEKINLDNKYYAEKIITDWDKYHWVIKEYKE
jgi:hypothetical protein